MPRSFGRAIRTRISLYTDEESLMYVEWTGKQTRHPEDLFTIIFQARVNGNNVSVYISQEAIDDGGIGACKSLAETKITRSIANGELPKQVHVTTSDLRG